MKAAPTVNHYVALKETHREVAAEQERPAGQPQRLGTVGDANWSKFVNSNCTCDFGSFGAVSLSRVATNSASNMCIT